MTPVTRGGGSAGFDHERATGRVREAFRRRFEYQSEFARQLGWTEQKVSRILRGETQLDLPDLLHICKVLRLSADWVLGIMPNEAFAAAGGPVDLVAVPVVTCEEAADDLAVASTASVCHLPGRLVRKAICHHEESDPAGEWPYGRLALCDISSAMFPPYGAGVLLDRRPDLSVIHGLHVLAKLEDASFALGRIYRLEGTITLVPENAPPRRLAGEGAIVGAIVALARPVGALG